MGQPILLLAIRICRFDEKHSYNLTYHTEYVDCVEKPLTNALQIITKSFHNLQYINCNEFIADTSQRVHSEARATYVFHPLLRQCG